MRPVSDILPKGAKYSKLLNALFALGIAAAILGPNIKKDEQKKLIQKYYDKYGKEKLYTTAWARSAAKENN